MLRARFFRWLHCLIHLHRAVTVEYPGLKKTVIACECGREWR